MPSHVHLLLAAAIALIAAAPSPAAEHCPAGELKLATSGAILTTAAAADTTYSTSGTVWLRAAYDLVAGSLWMYQCCYLSHTYVIARDDYDVTGVAPGTPVAVIAELAIDGSVWTDGCGASGCSGTLAGYLRHGTEVAQGVHSIHLFQGRTEVHDVLRLPVTIVAGAPETIEFELRGHRNPGGAHGSEAVGTIRFTGLAPGVSIRSCQGFAGVVTPVRRASWGAVKTIYR